MILPLGSIHADAYFALRNFYSGRKEMPVKIRSIDNKSTTLIDIVDLSPQALAMLSKFNNKLAA